jgi:hypothetical protein
MPEDYIKRFGKILADADRDFREDPAYAAAVAKAARSGRGRSKAS